MDKFRILIVEDNGLFRQTLRESLQKSISKIAVNEAAEGDEGLEENYSVCLWGNVGRKERDDRFSLGLLGVSECLGRLFKGSIWAGVRRREL